MSYSDEDLLRDDSSSSWNHLNHRRRHPLQQLQQQHQLPQTSSSSHHHTQQSHPQPGSSWNPHEHHLYPLGSSSFHYQPQHHRQLLQYQDDFIPQHQQPQDSWYATLNLHRHRHPHNTRRHTQQIITNGMSVAGEPNKPPRRTSNNASLTRGVSMSQLSKSQHQLNTYASVTPGYDEIDQHQYPNRPQPAFNAHQRRLSQDESISFLASHSSFKPITASSHIHRMDGVQHRNPRSSSTKPTPPPKPPRTTTTGNSIQAVPSSQLHQSKSQRNLAAYEEVGGGLGWQNQKSVDSYSHLPPPEGYGNIKRSISNDIAINEGFGTANNSLSGLHTSSSGISSLASSSRGGIEHEDAHQRLLLDPYTNENVYDEIDAGGGSGRNTASSSSSRMNSSASSFAIPSHKNTTDQIDEISFAHPSHNKSSSSSGVSFSQGNKQHLRSKSEHHTRYPATSSSDQNHPIYESLTKYGRGRSIDKGLVNGTSSHQQSGHGGNWVPPPLPPMQFKSQSTHHDNNNPSVSSIPKFEPPHVRLPSQDEYSVVLKPPTADIALKSIRTVIRPLFQEYKKTKTENKKNEGTIVEERLFPAFDLSGKKVSIRSRTMEHIPLLKDMSVMTDPVPEDFFHNPFTGTSRSSKVSGAGGGGSSTDDTNKTRSLRRIKNSGLSHGGTAERRKKKLGKTSVNSSTNNNTLNTTASEQDKHPSATTTTLVIKPIDIESGSSPQPQSQPATASGLPFDDRKEWAEIESILASFDSNFWGKSPAPSGRGSKNESQVNGGHRSTTPSSQPTKNSAQLRSDAQQTPKEDLKEGMEGVRDFLFSINLPDYTPLLIAHGFDDVRFMGGNVLEESDLRDVIGVKSSDHIRKIISTSRKKLPRMKLLDKTAQISVDEWLSSLSLTEYSDKLRENGFTDMSRLRKIWEYELNVVLDITKIGHRKRILTSLGLRTSLLSDLGLDDYDQRSASSVTPELIPSVDVHSEAKKEEESIKHTSRPLFVDSQVI